MAAGPLFALAMLAAPPAPSPWLEAKSEHFTLAGDVGADRLREVATELERIRIVLQQSPGAAKGDPLVPVTVVVTESGPGLREFGAETSKGQAGWFTRTPFEIQIAMRLDVGLDATKIAYHEYHHLLLDRGAPGAPHWIHEGLSQLWESVEIDRASFSVRGGRDLRRAIRWLRRHGTMPVQEMLDAREDRLTADLQRFYEQSHVVLHMLYVEDAEGPENVERFLREIGEGVKPAVAFAHVWQSPELLERRLRQFLEEPAYGSRTWPLDEKPAGAAAVELRPLMIAEVLSLRGSYLFGVNDPVRAKRAVIAAIVENPHDVRALTHLAMLDPTSDLSFELLERAANAPEADFLSHWLFALRSTSPRPAAARPEEALFTPMLGIEKVTGHLEKAIALEPGFAGAHVLLARHLEATDPARALAAMRKAAEAEPESPAHLLRVAQLERRAGREPEAEALAREAAERAGAIGPGVALLDVCVQGAAHFAASVKEACDRAVVWKSNVLTRGARAKARAMAGDFTGAVADLDWLAGSTDDVEDAARHRAAIEALRDEKNPFDAVALEIEAAQKDLGVGRLR